MWSMEEEYVSQTGSLKENVLEERWFVFGTIKGLLKDNSWGRSFYLEVMSYSKNWG